MKQPAVLSVVVGTEVFREQRVVLFHRVQV